MQAPSEVYLPFAERFAMPVALKRASVASDPVTDSSTGSSPWGESRLASSAPIRTQPTGGYFVVITRVRRPSFGPHDPAFEAFLLDVQHHLGGETRSFLTDCVRDFLGAVRGLVGGIGLPQAGLTDDGTIQLVWRSDRLHIEIDIFESGKYDWFYRERETGSYNGGEQLLINDGLAPELVTRLRQIK